jgi:Predicted Fe-S oxidoreductases
MSFELFKLLFDKVRFETKQYDTITFSGFGEPLLDEGLFEKIKYAKSKGFKVLILTNGSKLTVDTFKKLQYMNVDSIRISFYGISSSSYCRVHGISNIIMFEKVKQNLIDISEIKSHTQIILTYNIVDAINSSETQQWIDFWKERVDLVEVWKPHNWVNGKSYRQVQKDKLKTCGRPWNTPLQIQVDGTVNMCCFDYNGKLLLGDLKTDSLNDIFNSDAFQLILKCHENGNFEDSGLICENCDQRNSAKSDVMVYNSIFDVRDRVGKFSTTYTDLQTK